LLFFKGLVVTLFDLFDPVVHMVRHRSCALPTISIKTPARNRNDHTKPTRGRGIDLCQTFTAEADVHPCGGSALWHRIGVRITRSRGGGRYTGSALPNPLLR